MSGNPLTVFTSSAGRRFVDVADLAAICGVTAYDLDHRHRPAHWAMPHDAFWDGTRMWFAIAGLHELCDSLLAAGKADAALKLRERMAPWVEAAVTEQRLVTAGGAGERESWSTKWERDHA